MHPFDPDAGELKGGPRWLRISRDGLYRLPSVATAAPSIR